MRVSRSVRPFSILSFTWARLRQLRYSCAAKESSARATLRSYFAHCSCCCCASSDHSSGTSPVARNCCIATLNTSPRSAMSSWSWLLRKQSPVSEGCPRLEFEAECFVCRLAWFL